MAFSEPIGEFYVAIGLETSAFRRELRRTQSELRRAIGSDAIGLSQDLARSMGVLALAAGGVVTSMVVMAAKFEQTTVAFSTLMKSTEKATALLYDLDQFAAKTPFVFDELTAASRTMLAFGFNSKEVLPILQQLGDVAAGSGQSIGDLAFLYGKAHISGRIMAKDLNQFLLRGIPLIQEFARQFGVAETEIRGMVTEGKVKFSNLEEAMRNITTGSGLFTDSMIRQSRTMEGLWSTLSDNVLMFMKRTGKAIADGFNLREKMAEMVVVLEQFNAKINTLGVGYALQDAFGPELRTAIALTAGAITGMLIPALQGVVVWGLAAAVPLMPFALLGAAVVGLVVVVKQSWSELVYQTKYMVNTIRHSFWDLIETISNLGVQMSSILLDLGIAGGKYTTHLVAAASVGVSQFQRMADAAKTSSNSIKKSMVENMLAYQYPQKSLLAHVTALATGSEEGVASLDKLTQAAMRYVNVAKSGMSPEVAKNFTSAWIKLKSLFSGGGEAPVTQIAEGPEDSGAADKLKSDAESITKSIEAGWAQSTQSKMQQTEIWYKDQLETLEKSKGQIANYNEVLGKLDATAFAKRKEIIDEDIAGIKKKFDTEVKAKQDLANIAQKAMEKEIEQQAAFIKQRAEFLKNEINGENLRSALAVKENAADLAGYMKLLTDKRAAFLADIEGRKELISAYDQFQQEAHRSQMSYMAEGFQTLYRSGTDMFVGLVMGSKNLGQSIKELGADLIAMVVKWKAQRVLASLFSKGLQASEVAVSSAAAAAVTAAWTSAAVMVNTATMGGAAAAGGASLAAFMASAGAMNVIPMAAGGIATRPTLAMIAEAGEAEVVAPLSKLKGMIGQSGSQVTVNVINQTGQPVSSRSSQRMDGATTVIDLFLEGYSRNTRGIQDIMGGR